MKISLGKSHIFVPEKSGFGLRLRLRRYPSSFLLAGGSQPHGNFVGGNTGKNRPPLHRKKKCGSIKLPVYKRLYINNTVRSRGFVKYVIRINSVRLNCI